MTIWFTADHHFGHDNIVAHRDRPFADAAEMDEVLIDHWNATVRPSDEVWHLGNFAHRCGPNRRTEIFDRLVGAAKHLVRGNLDRRFTPQLSWTSVQDYAEIQYDHRTIVLFHYPLLVWHRSKHGAWSLHASGASEVGNDRPLGSCAVGVDEWMYRPVSLEEIAVVLRHRVDG